MKLEQMIIIVLQAEVLAQHASAEVKHWLEKWQIINLNCLKAMKVIITHKDISHL